MGGNLARGAASDQRSITAPASPVGRRSRPPPRALEVAAAIARRYAARVPTRLARAALSAALAAAVAAAPARAGGALPPTAADLSGARATALGGAARGVAFGNEAIFVNAASLAARRRYSLEAHWLLDRAGGATDGQQLSLIVVDSELSEVAGGFAYTRVASGPSVGNVLHAAFAAPLGGRVLAGITAKYLSLSGADDMRAVTGDASLFVPLGRIVSVGVAGYNLVPVGHVAQAPRGVGAGASAGGGSWLVAADWRRDLQRRGRATDAYAVGAEAIAGRWFPLRGGWQKDEARGGEWWSAGTGFATAAGVAMDFTYRQGIRDSADRTFGAALKVVLLQ
jgi:hypothetical protein